MEIILCPCGSEVLNILDQCQVCQNYLCFNCIIKNDTKCLNCAKNQKTKNQIKKQKINQCKSCQKEFLYKNHNICFECDNKLCSECKICQEHNGTCEICFKTYKPITSEQIKNLNDTKFVKPIMGKKGTSRCSICSKRWCNDCGFRNVVYVNNLVICREHYIECVNIPCGKQFVGYFKCDSCNIYLCPYCSKEGKCYDC